MKFIDRNINNNFINNIYLINVHTSSFQVYLQLKAIIVKLILAYPQHTLWMMLSVIKSSYPQRMKRCADVFSDPRLKEPQMLKLVSDFTQFAEKLIELCNKPIVGTGSVSGSCGKGTLCYCSERGSVMLLLKAFLNVA